MPRAQILCHPIDVEGSEQPPPDDSSDSDNDDCELEYDVYGWFNFDDDKEGVRRLDRQWVLLGAAAAADGWEDAVQAYEEKINKKKQELE